MRPPAKRDLLRRLRKPVATGGPPPPRRAPRCGRRIAPLPTGAQSGWAQSVSGLTGKLEPQRTDPRIELLLCKLALERLEADLPERGRRHGMESSNGQPGKKSGRSRKEARRSVIVLPLAQSYPQRCAAGVQRSALTKACAKCSNLRLFR